jgi:hypothetical protein
MRTLKAYLPKQCKGKNLKWIMITAGTKIEDDLKITHQTKKMII